MELYCKKGQLFKVPKTCFDVTWKLFTLLKSPKKSLKRVIIVLNSISKFCQILFCWWNGVRICLIEIICHLKLYIVWYNKINKIKFGINWQFFYWSDLKSHICKHYYNFILITYFNIYCKKVQLDYFCQNVCNQTTKCISLLLEFMYFRRTFKIKLILLFSQ